MADLQASVLFPEHWRTTVPAAWTSRCLKEEERERLKHRAGRVSVQLRSSGILLLRIRALATASFLCFLIQTAFLTAIGCYLTPCLPVWNSQCPSPLPCFSSAFSTALPDSHTPSQAVSSAEPSWSCIFHCYSATFFSIPFSFTCLSCLDFYLNYIT